jgi:hypothetical protein
MLVVNSRNVPAVAPSSSEWLAGRKDRGHARLVLNLLKQLLADQEGLDAFLDDLRHRPRNHEGGVLDVQRVGDRNAFAGVFGLSRGACIMRV